MDPKLQKIEQLAEKIKETEKRTIEVEDTDAWSEALCYRDYRGPRKCPTKKEEVVEPTKDAGKAMDELAEMLASESQKIAQHAKSVLTIDYPEDSTRSAIKRRLQKAYDTGPRQVRELLGASLGYSRFRLWFNNLFSK